MTIAGMNMQADTSHTVITRIRTLPIPDGYCRTDPVPAGYTSSSPLTQATPGQSGAGSGAAAPPA